MVRKIVGAGSSVIAGATDGVCGVRWNILERRSTTSDSQGGASPGCPRARTVPRRPRQQTPAPSGSGRTRVPAASKVRLLT